MNFLSFPDLNVWFAVAMPEHPHAAAARRWWESTEGEIAFSRTTQLGLLRLVTTAAVMGGKPLTMDKAWELHDRFFEDGRISVIVEPTGAEERFRRMAVGKTASPKLWADLWLLAVAQAAGGEVVTFDRALVARGARSLLSQIGA